MRAVTWPSNFSALLSESSPGGLSGRMSPVFCRQMEDGILVPSSGRWRNSGMGSPTESWTLNTSDWPKDANVCSLSDILETGDHLSRYCLSPKACRGILRRAGNRGKTLPLQLAHALQAVVDSEPTSISMED